MKKDHPPTHSNETCPVCGMQAGHCRHLDRLGTRSVDNRKPDTCPVCGSDYSLVVWVKGFKMCGLCAENIDQALRILRHKHRKRLGAILIALDRESA